MILDCSLKHIEPLLVEHASCRGLCAALYNFTVLVCDHSAACGLSSTCFCVVFGLDKYVGYLIVSMFWRKMEKEVVGTGFVVTNAEFQKL